MSYQQDDHRSMGPKPMVNISTLNITCSECGAPINELPFEPAKKEDGTYGRLYCYECNKARNIERGPRKNFGR